MNLSEDLSRITTVFIDTAPIIYYIEAHPQYGPLIKDAVAVFQTGNLNAFSSVITITEVLSKPVEMGDEKLARKFAEFLKNGRNLVMLEINETIAETAGRLRGRYSFLKTIDAVQIAAALNIGADAFLTNDIKLKQMKDIRVLVLKDYL